METNTENVADHHAESAASNIENVEALMDTDSVPQEETHHQYRKKHEDHYVSRKYRMFSNHSSAGDMPFTNTSF